MLLSGQLLDRDTIVAEITDNQVKPVIRERLPLYLARGGSFTLWLASRAVDSSRPNSRILKKMLKLKNTDDIHTVLHVHAATITDRFWFRREGETVTWDQVRFTANPYANLALSGTYLAYNDAALSQINGTNTPELTNIGSFEKAWKLENGVWHLYKQGSADERFSELAVCRLGMMLGFDMAVYESAGRYIKSRDFTAGWLNYEPAASVVGDSVDETEICRTLQSLHPKLIPQYINIIYLDALAFNVDRHSYNFGFLRNPDTGEIVSMAPNFDNNLSLIARGTEGSPYHTSTLLIQDFKRLLENVGGFYTLPKHLTEEQIRYVAAQSLPDETVDRDFAAEMLISRQRMLRL